MTDPPPQNAAIPDARETRIEALVRAERVRALHERLGISQVTVLLNSSVAAIVFWGKSAPGRLVVWLAAVWLVAAVRVAVGSRYRRWEATPDRVTRWGRIYTAGALLNGLAWGAAPLLLLGDGLSLAHAIFLAFLLGGMAAGAALSNSSHPPAFFAFAVPALLPISVVLVSGGDRLRVAMGVLLAVFGAAVTAISLSGGRSLAEAVRLQYRNADLAARVTRAAAELESRVQDRTAQLEAALAREREAERRLAQAARLASLGTLAAGVAHEVNNPLAYLRSNLHFVRDELARGAIAPEQRGAVLDAMRDAADGVERVGVIVRQLTDLSLVELGGGLEPVDLHLALDACIDMAGPELLARAKVVRSYGSIPEVLGELTGLVQVFLNLIVNAAEAIPEGTPDAHTIRITTTLDARSGEVVVEVADDGAGIPGTALDRIWAPFYTTKPARRGAGLGLPICKSIVAGLGGWIAVRSQEGVGSTFTVGLKPVPAA